MEYNEISLESTVKNMLKGFAYHKIITDYNGKPIDFCYVQVNSAFEKLIGLKREEIIGKRIKEIIKDMETVDFDWINFFGNVALSGIPKSVDKYINALEKWCEVSVFSPQKGYFIAVFTDITVIKKKEIELIKRNNELINKLKESRVSTIYQASLFDNSEVSCDNGIEINDSEQRIIKLAYFDALTNLPNRVLFTDRLNNAIAEAKRNGTKVGIVYLDMDNFKNVNDTLGHASGDELLIKASSRIQLCMREYDTVCRLCGDEFSVMMKDIESVDGIINIVERILEVFNEPFYVGNSSLNITVSMGISIFPDHGETVESLLRYADTAMYKAKKIGKNGYQFFNKKMKKDILRKINIEIMLKNAIIKDEFILYYQPQFEAKTKKLRGFEALIRWDNPEMGILKPADFISIAEETGMISVIGKWVLYKTCKLISEINTKYRNNIVIGVNISPHQLKEKDFYDNVVKVIESSGINPSCLELEFPESIFVDDLDFSIKALKALKELGVRIALDGFGTGYSSLSYLTELPIDLLKLDKSFIKKIDALNPKNDLTESIISLVHKLKIETFAAGVENKEQLEYLISAKCDNVQGFYLGKPVPEEEIDIILREALTI